eukprot:13190.XXX_403057_403293_1 [CDS] Oithona nana genome sequencing.
MNDFLPQCNKSAMNPSGGCSPDLANLLISVPEMSAKSSFLSGS